MNRPSGTVFKKSNNGVPNIAPIIDAAEATEGPKALVRRIIDKNKAALNGMPRTYANVRNTTLFSGKKTATKLNPVTNHKQNSAKAGGGFSLRILDFNSGANFGDSLIFSVKLQTSYSVNAKSERKKNWNFSRLACFFFAKACAPALL